MLQGQYIDGRYKIIKAIGSGGMANVYLAKDLILERSVAIKLMRYDFSDDEENIKRFKREATATTELNHKNIVSVYDIGEDHDYYIVMEYVDGMNLKEYIRQHFPIPYAKVVDIMGQILEGVDYAHRHGIIHRDLKPHNILIDSKDQVKITDFGIAVALSKNSITQTNSLLGSVQYISPEQAKGAIPSPQSDIYSLGILLFEMLSQEVPYDGESAVSIALQHFQKPLPSLRDFDPQIPQALENVVIKATAKNPKYRYQTANDMRQDLMTSLYPERMIEEKYVIPSSDHEQTIKMDAIQPPVEPKEDKDLSPRPKPQPPTEPVLTQRPKAEQLDYQEEFKQKKKKRRRPWWMILVLFLLALFLIFFYFNTQPNSVRIPDVKGMTEEQARSVLEEMDLLIGQVKEEASEEYDQGEVTRTNPQVNTSVREKSEVDLFISTGQEAYQIPDFTGKDFEEVRAQLTEIGFTVNRENEASSTYEEGKIVGQDLAAGEEHVPSESTITLTVSTGQPSFTLRDLTQYSWQGVLDYAEERGLQVSRTDRPSATVPQGLVIAQYPQAGTELKEGDSLSVEISTGPESPPASDSSQSDEEEGHEGEPTQVTVHIPFQENDQSDTNTVDIYIDDKQSDFSQAYRSLTIEADTTIRISLDLDPGQSGAYRVVRDGETIEESRVTG